MPFASSIQKSKKSLVATGNSFSNTQRGFETMEVKVMRDNLEENLAPDANTHEQQPKTKTINFGSKFKVNIRKRVTAHQVDEEDEATKGHASGKAKT